VVANVAQNDRTPRTFEPIVHVPYAQHSQPNMTLPNFSGVWELNLERSQLKGAVPRRIVVTIEHDGTIIRQLVQVTSASGEELQNEFVFQTTGAAMPIAFGGNAGHTSARWHGSTLIVETRLTAAGRELNFRDHWSLSADGGVLTMAHPDDDLAGQVSVLERAPPESSAGI